MPEDWLDPFADEAARERERRRAERAERRDGESTPEGASQAAGSEPPVEPEPDVAHERDRVRRERRELLAHRVQRRLVKARLAYPDAGRRKPLPPQRRAVRRRRIGVAIAGLIILAGVVAGLVALVGQLGGDEEAPAPVVPRTKTVTIAEGHDRAEVAELLKDTSITGDYVKASESFKGFDPARYGAESPESLEGFLFPDTYELPKHATVEDLIERQLAAFQANIKSVDMRYAESKNLTPYDVLIIASMVEEEVAVPSERRLVAAVIYNRLHEGMPLGIDATIRYITGNHTEPLTQSELAIDSPYNTRTQVGLPPGPIDSPGLASIEAAAHPAHVPYLYYVVKPDTCPPKHFFTDSDAEFQAAVDRYNAAREAAGGESPTC
jgi:cell division protein YceG involved in septum cleavage